MGALEKMAIVREGVWLYEQSVPIHLRILSSPETWCSGDYEDEDSVAENQPIPCFFLAYEAAGAPGNFCNIVPNLASFEAALAYAEQKFPGINKKGSDSLHANKSLQPTPGSAFSSVALLLPFMNSFG